MGKRRAQSGSVLIVSGEDSAENTLLPRLKAAGANEKQVFFFEETVRGSKGKEEFFRLDRHLDVLEEAVERLGVKLVMGAGAVPEYGGGAEMGRHHDL